MNIRFSKSEICIQFDYPLRALSSAFYNGGYGRRDGVLNIKVDGKDLIKYSPKDIVLKKIAETGMPDNSCAMLTSAELQYAQIKVVEERGIMVASIVSAGTSNALNISEKLDTIYSGAPQDSFADKNAGTINIVILTNMLLTSDCLASSIITATEGKTAAIFDLGIKSRSGKKFATGTGTDSITIVSGNKNSIKYAGGHTTFGQLVGQVVYSGVTDALQKKRCNFSEGIKKLNKYLSY